MSAILRMCYAARRVVFFEGWLKLTTLSYSIAPTVRLNNRGCPCILGEGGLTLIHTDFQTLGRLASISYLETDNGPTAKNRWSVTVKSKRICSGSRPLPLTFAP